MTSFLKSVRNNAFPLTLAISLFALLALCWTSEEQYNSDIDGYLDFVHFRTAGYPLLLDAVEFLFGGLRFLPALQLAFWLICLFYLALGLRGRVPAALLLPALLLIAWVPQIHYGLYRAVLTDSVFTSLIVLGIGGAVRFAARPCWRTALLVSFALGLAMTVRPVGLGLAATLPVLLWLVWPALRGWSRRRRLLLAVALLLPLPALYGAEYGYWLHTHRDPSLRNYQVDLHMFSWVMVAGEKPLRTDYPDLTAIATSVRNDPVVTKARAMLDHAPTWQTRVHMHHYAVSAMIKRFAINPDWTDRLPLDYRIVFRRVGRDGILREPDRYALHALNHYWAYWMVWTNGSPRTRATWDDYWERYLDDVVAVDRSVANWGGRWHYPMRAWMLTMLGLTVLSVCWAFWRRLRRPHRLGAVEWKRPELLIVAAVCALGVHAMLLLTTATAFAEFRYLMPSMPLLSVCALLTVVCGAGVLSPPGTARRWPGRRMRYA